jgi:hypothetical protein
MLQKNMTVQLGPGGNLGTARRVLAGAGTQTAGLAFGGSFQPSPPTNAQKNMMEQVGQQVEI